MDTKSSGSSGTRGKIGLQQLDFAKMATLMFKPTMLAQILKLIPDDLEAWVVCKHGSDRWRKRFLLRDRPTAMLAANSAAPRVYAILKACFPPLPPSLSSGLRAGPALWVRAEQTAGSTS
jgi:hypothetical protein